MRYNLNKEDIEFIKDINNTNQDIQERFGCGAVQGTRWRKEFGVVCKRGRKKGKELPHMWSKEPTPCKMCKTLHYNKTYCGRECMWSDPDYFEKNSRPRPHMRKDISPEEKLARSRRNREKMGKEYFQNYKLVKQYGITLEDFNNMMEKQDNKCYICDTVFESKKETRVDHNHDTGEVRKILCHNCNAMLGHSKENIQTLHNAIEYLGEHC